MRFGNKRYIGLGFLIILLCMASFFGGYFYQKENSNQIAPPQSLRLNGYHFIDPLLACNINNSHIFPQNSDLNNTISSLVANAENNGVIEKASVYFINFSDGTWESTNPSETYYPSSLGKIPIMIAYYEIAETTPSILYKEITYTGGTNLNDTQDIPPPNTIVQGKTYTIEQLIEYMIKYSDNNAADLLYENISTTALKNVYQNLGIPTKQNPTAANLDFITPQQISLLFRVLYNSTYLNRDYSEKALELMGQSSFMQGIAAGLPASTTVSHKFGLVGIQDNGVSVEHELHDCGIVYAKSNYLLCVMTRGTGSLSNIEALIASISRAVYATSS